MNVISIDAWGNEDDGYDWNAWHKVGDIQPYEFDSINSYVQWFIDNGYIFPDKSLYYAEDDGCNIVIYIKETKEPIYAIEYSY